MIKLNLKLKFFSIIKLSIVYLLICFNAYADNLKIDNNAVVIGPDDAAIKIKIFSSFTCPHCAKFHLNVVPEIEKKYVDTGLVQLVFIDFPLDQAAFNVSKLLHCIEKKNQINFMDDIYKNQTQWASGSNIEDINIKLKKIVKVFGIDDDQFEKCLINDKIGDKILNNRIDAGKKYSISATPTIVINEKKLEDSANFKNIKKQIESII
jgi:protein-disulfide isomerase